MVSTAVPGREIDGLSQRSQASALEPTPKQGTATSEADASSTGIETGGGGAADAVIQSLFQPGLNTPLRMAMNVTFVLLLLTLAGLSILTRGNPHFLALLAIASCLWAAVAWFLTELAKLPPSAFQVQVQPDAQETIPIENVDPPTEISPKPTENLTTTASPDTQ